MVYLITLLPFRKANIQKIYIKANIQKIYIPVYFLTLLGILTVSSAEVNPL